MEINLESSCSFLWAFGVRAGVALNWKSRCEIRAKGAASKRDVLGSSYLRTDKTYLSRMTFAVSRKAYALMFSIVNSVFCFKRVSK